MVEDSFTDDPVRLRDFRYAKAEIPPAIKNNNAAGKSIALIINDKHDIHHVHDRGYVEAPVRIRSILKEIIPSGLFEQFEPHNFSEKHIRAVHDKGFVDYLKKVCIECSGQ